MLTAKEISSKKFDKAKGFGGYRVDDVEDFMDRVAEYVTTMENERGDIEKKMAVLAEKLEEYRSDEDSLRTALLGAQKLGDGVIRESKTKAEIILRDAAIKADKIISDAHTQLQNEERKLAQTKRDAGIFRAQLLELYKRHIAVVETIPGAPSEPIVIEEPRPAPQPTPTQQMAEPGENTMEFDMSQAVVMQAGAAQISTTPKLTTRRDHDEDSSGDGYSRADMQRGAAGAVRSKADFAAQDDEEEDEPESKFGTLKFGENFNLTRTDDPGSKRRK